MADTLQKGTLYWWKPQGEKRRLHLVASSPAGPLVIVVPIQSYRTGYDKRCLLNEAGMPKDILVLDWASIPACAYVDAMTPEKLAGIIASKECKVIDEVVGQKVINRILTNVYCNKDRLKPGVFDALEAMRKANQSAQAAPVVQATPVTPPKKGP